MYPPKSHSTDENPSMGKLMKPFIQERNQNKQYQITR